MHAIPGLVVRGHGKNVRRFPLPKHVLQQPASFLADADGTAGQSTSQQLQTCMFCTAAASKDGGGGRAHIQTAEMLTGNA